MVVISKQVLLSEKIEVANALWRHNIRAEVCDPNSIIDSLKKRGVCFIIVLKEGQLINNSGMVTLKNLKSSREAEVTVEQAIEAIKQKQCRFENTGQRRDKDLLEELLR